MFEDTVYLDAETTGFSAKKGDMVELSIIHDDGRILFDRLLCPTKVSTWPEAQAIHGISPEDVKWEPVLADVKNDIIEAVKGMDVIIYNKAFDTKFLVGLLDGANSVQCCMLDYAEWFGTPSKRSGYNRSGYKWHKLIDAAENCGHVWDGKAHRAKADCEATRTVWRTIKS